MRRIVLISFLLLFVAITYAQKMQKVTATYTYYAPENVTLEEAKRTALDRAKLIVCNSWCLWNIGNTEQHDDNIQSERKNRQPILFVRR